MAKSNFNNHMSTFLFINFGFGIQQPQYIFYGGTERITIAERIKNSNISS